MTTALTRRSLLTAALAAGVAEFWPLPHGWRLRVHADGAAHGRTATSSG